MNTSIQFACPGLNDPKIWSCNVPMANLIAWATNAGLRFAKGIDLQEMPATPPPFKAPRQGLNPPAIGWHNAVTQPLCVPFCVT